MTQSYSVSSTTETCACLFKHSYSGGHPGCVFSFDGLSSVRGKERGVRMDRGFGPVSLRSQSRVWRRDSWGAGSCVREEAIIQVQSQEPKQAVDFGLWN